MAETQRDPAQGAATPARRRSRFAAAAIARFHRVVPKNFGVDLQPKPADAPRVSIFGLIAGANLGAFARSLLTTRLDRSGARIRTAALGMFVAFAAIGAKLIVLGV